MPVIIAASHEQSMVEQVLIEGIDELIVTDAQSFWYRVDQELLALLKRHPRKSLDINIITKIKYMPKNMVN